MDSISFYKYEEGQSKTCTCVNREEVKKKMELGKWTPQQDQFLVAAVNAKAPIEKIARV